VRKVLDSWAMLAWLQNEKPANEYIRNLIKLANNGDLGLFINIINLGEVYYNLMRTRGENAANLFWADFGNSSINLVGVNKSITLTAAKLKGNHRISYADAFAVATAIIYDCPLLTGDPEFRSVESLIKIEWLERQ
jgi:predicted nucleic acid-binding protein